MRCYRCDSIVTGDVCRTCGTDLRLYKKVLRMSNGFYNIGLEKAKVRDLTGAAAALRRSLQLNKRNTAARNLLGLICYERGELSAAIAHWVISSNYDKVDNPAREYLDRVLGDKSEFERMSRAIRQYNLALKNARIGNEDIAKATLRRVISQNPRMMRARELLALLYIHASDYSRAARVLKGGLAIDIGSTVCLRYMEEVRKARGASSASQRSRNKKEEDDYSKSPGYIGHRGKEKTSNRSVMVGILAGAAICFLVYFALIRPTQMAAVNRRWNERLIENDERISDRILEADNLKKDKEELESELETVRKDLDRYAGADGLVVNYEKLLSALSSYFGSEWSEFVGKMGDIDPEKTGSETYRAVYAGLQDFISSGVIADKIYESGMDKFNAARYTTAIGDFEQCLAFDPTYEAAIFQIGLCYEALGDDATAAGYFERIIREFPDGRFAELAKIRV